MNPRNFTLPGVAAIALAILFPIYWVSILGQSFDDFSLALQQNLTTLDGSDALFILIGALEVYVYLSLRKSLKDYMDTKIARVMLMVMAGIIIFFHSTILLDLYLAVTASYEDSILNSFTMAAMIIAGAGLVLYSIVGLAFGILLIMKARDISPLLMVFGILLVIMCGLQMTFFLAFLNIFLFPAALLILGFHFLKDHGNVEIV